MCVVVCAAVCVVVLASVGAEIVAGETLVVARGFCEVREEEGAEDAEGEDEEGCGGAEGSPLFPVRSGDVFFEERVGEGGEAVCLAGVGAGDGVRGDEEGEEEVEEEEAEASLDAAAARTAARDMLP